MDAQNKMGIGSVHSMGKKLTIWNEPLFSCILLNSRDAKLRK